MQPKKEPFSLKRGADYVLCGPQSVAGALSQRIRRHAERENATCGVNKGDDTANDAADL
jgi:hypothetical protein